MRKYIFIGIGAFFGAIARYLIKSIHLFSYDAVFPLCTFCINITGSFLLAFILTIAFEVWAFDSDIRLGITTGFLGAYTTFSTFCKETVILLNNAEYVFAFLYMILSVLIGLLVAYLGVILARKIEVDFSKA